ncbi:LCP family protein [Nocardioides sp. SYSU D00038]|uniref:LCP family protein n=1 Tax=Nocardioides sp. SYSU D00038 TaxID=2812554 RepID=UPI001966D8B3|nr:LCP family protein [Nocardioides sp. SYSU D00038]
MADRPRNDGPEDGPEYSWLYGEGGPPPEQPPPTRPAQQRPRDPRPDETRVMRTQPREPVRPTPPPIAPSPGPGDPDDGPSRPRRRFRLRYLLVLLLLWVAFTVGTPIHAWTSVNKVAWEPDGDRPKDQPGTTYLLVGSDSRAGLSKKERRELATGDAEGQRTDTIMLLHTGSGPNVLLSLPRDSIVDIPGRGTNKINAAYAFGGPQLLVRTIESNTGIRVDDYVEIGMGGVVGVVDAVGGIEICPRRDMKDAQAGLNIKKGCQEVDGKVALGYARSRKTAALGDIDRVRRQREVVSAVGAKVMSPWTVLNPVRWWQLTHSTPDFFAFGEGTSAMRAGLWAMAMTRVDGDSGLTCVVPIADLAVNWDPERAPEMFQKIIEDDTDSIGKSLCTPKGLPR